MYRENVLNGTKCVLFPILYRRNVLGGTKWIFASRIVRRGRGSRSDSSAQVLRNSRPEFRLLPLLLVQVNDFVQKIFHRVTLASIVI